MLQEVVVSVRTLKSLCADLNVEAIDVLHVDAQGSDLEVLRSAGEILQTVKAGVVEAGKRLQLYTNTAARPEIIWFLTKRGFRIVRVVPNDRFNFEQNVFFIPSRHRRVWTVIHALMQMVLADVSLWLGKRSPLNRLAVRASLTLRHRARQIREARPDKSNKGS